MDSLKKATSSEITTLAFIDREVGLSEDAKELVAKEANGLEGGRILNNTRVIARNDAVKEDLCGNCQGIDFSRLFKPSNKLPLDRQFRETRSSRPSR